MVTTGWCNMQNVHIDKKEQLDMPRMTLTAARREIGEAVNKLVYGKEDRIILSRRGKDLAVILPISYLEILDKIEDRWLQEKAKKALKEKGEISWAKVKKDLGL
jgi:prevent-host-death family protein